LDFFGQQALESCRASMNGLDDGGRLASTIRSRECPLPRKLDATADGLLMAYSVEKLENASIAISCQT
jgi:hypothetical protein